MDMKKRYFEVTSYGKSLNFFMDEGFDFFVEVYQKVYPKIGPTHQITPVIISDIIRKTCTNHEDIIKVLILLSV